MSQGFQNFQIMHEGKVQLDGTGLPVEKPRKALHEQGFNNARDQIEEGFNWTGRECRQGKIRQGLHEQGLNARRTTHGETG